MSQHNCEEQTNEEEGEQLITSGHILFLGICFLLALFALSVALILKGFGILP